MSAFGRRNPALPVLVIALLPIAAGFLLLAGRAALDRDLHAQSAVG